MSHEPPRRPARRDNVRYGTVRRPLLAVRDEALELLHLHNRGLHAKRLLMVDFDSLVRHRSSSPDDLARGARDNVGLYNAVTRNDLTWRILQGDTTDATDLSTIACQIDQQRTVRLRFGGRELAQLRVLRATASTLPAVALRHGRSAELPAASTSCSSRSRRTTSRGSALRSHLE